MVTTEATLETQRSAVLERLGLSVGSFHSKWAGIRFGRFEPGWGQSVQAFAENILDCALTARALELEGSADTEAIAAALAAGETLEGDNQNYALAALAMPYKFTKEFSEYWGGKLGFRINLAKELGGDISTLVGAIDDASKELAALAPGGMTEPPRPDVT